MLFVVLLLFHLRPDARQWENTKLPHTLFLISSNHKLDQLYPVVWMIHPFPYKRFSSLCVSYLNQ